MELAVAAPHAVTPAVLPPIDPHLAEASWSIFAHRSSTNSIAAWLLRVPTWAALALLLGLMLREAGLRLSLRRAPAIALAAVCTLLPAAAQLYGDRAGGWLMVDFRAYYCASLVQREGMNPYFVQPLHDCERSTPAPYYHATPNVTIPAPYPPYVLAFLTPLTFLPFGAAAIAWWILMAFAGALAVYALARVSARTAARRLGRARAFAGARLVLLGEHFAARARRDRVRGTLSSARARRCGRFRNCVRDGRAAHRASRGGRALCGVFFDSSCARRCACAARRHFGIQRRARADARLRHRGVAGARAGRGLARQPVQSRDHRGIVGSIRRHRSCRRKHFVSIDDRVGCARGIAAGAALRRSRVDFARSSGLCAAWGIVRPYRGNRGGRSGLPRFVRAFPELSRMAFRRVDPARGALDAGNLRRALLGANLPGWIPHVRALAQRSRLGVARRAGYRLRQSWRSFCFHRSLRRTRWRTTASIPRSIRDLPRRAGAIWFCATPQIGSSCGCCAFRPGWDSLRSHCRHSCWQANRV